MVIQLLMIGAESLSGVGSEISAFNFTASMTSIRLEFDEQYPDETFGRQVDSDYWVGYNSFNKSGGRITIKASIKSPNISSEM